MDKLLAWHDFYVNNRLRIKEALSYDLSNNEIRDIAYKNKEELLRHKVLGEERRSLLKINSEIPFRFNMTHGFFLKNYIRKKGLVSDPRFDFQNYLIDCFSKGDVPDPKIAGELLEGIIVKDNFKLKDELKGSYTDIKLESNQNDYIHVEKDGENIPYDEIMELELSLIPRVNFDLHTLKEFDLKELDEEVVKNIKSRLSDIKKMFPYLRQEHININSLDKFPGFNFFEHDFHNSGVYNVPLLVVDALRVLNINKAHDLWKEGKYLEAFSAFEELNSDFLVKRRSCRGDYIIGYPWNPYSMLTGEHLQIITSSKPFLNEQVRILEDMIAPDVKVSDDYRLIIENKPKEVVIKGKLMLNKLLTKPETVNPEKKPYEKPAYLDELKQEQTMLGLTEFKGTKLNISA